MVARSKKSTARKSTARKSTAKRTSTRRRKASPLEFGSRHYRCKATVGSLELEGPDGQKFSPAACGVHRSMAVNETATDKESAPAKGFQSDCEDCAKQAGDTALHALRHHTV